MYKIINRLASFTPEGILPLLLTDDFFKLRKDRLEKTLLFLTVLYFRGFYGKKDTYIQDEFIYIRSKLIGLYMGKYYKDIIDKLDALKIIEVNDSYFSKVFTKSYKLLEPFRSQMPIARKIEYDIVLNKISTIENYYISKLPPHSSNPFTIRQMENCKYISIDVDEARARTNELELTDDQKHYYHECINVIATGNIQKICIAESNGRLFSAFTGVPRELRPYLYIQDSVTGEMIFDKKEIDGSNTQPMLLSLKMQSEGVELDDDLLKLCLDGLLYKQMATELTQKLGFTFDRDFIKERMMDTLLYTKDNGNYLRKIKERTELQKKQCIFNVYFQKRFPKFFSWLLKTKKHYAKLNKDTSENKKNPGGSQLALEIQRMESEIWIQRMQPLIPDGTIYITIHDSIMVFNPQGDIMEFLEQKFKEISMELYNVEMPVKIKSV